MTFQIYQIDAWRNPDNTWQYNQWFPIQKIEIEGKITTRKILKKLREIGLLFDKSIYRVNDYFSFEGTWCVQLRNGMPLLDLVEQK